MPRRLGIGVGKVVVVVVSLEWREPFEQNLVGGLTPFLWVMVNLDMANPESARILAR